VDGADNDDPERWIEGVDEKLAVADFGNAASILPQEPADLRPGILVQSEAAMIDILVNQRLKAGPEIGHQSDRLLFSARFHKTLENIGFHSTAST
jgi:hypothetical protein